MAAAEHSVSSTSFSVSEFLDLCLTDQNAILQTAPLFEPDFKGNKVEIL